MTLTEEIKRAESALLCAKIHLDNVAVLYQDAMSDYIGASNRLTDLQRKEAVENIQTIARPDFQMS